jgi:hypothetical protein
MPAGVRTRVLFVELFVFKDRAIEHQLVGARKRRGADQPNRIVGDDVELGCRAVVLARQHEHGAVWEYLPSITARQCESRSMCHVLKLYEHEFHHKHVNIENREDS